MLKAITQTGNAPALPGVTLNHGLQRHLVSDEQEMGWEVAALSGCSDVMDAQSSDPAFCGINIHPPSCVIYTHSGFCVIFSSFLFPADPG